MEIQSQKTIRLFNRELSWIEFNARVLAEAEDPSNPLLERLKFMGIVSSNFDEFFMVRIASLKDFPDIAKQACERAYRIIEDQNQHFHKSIVPALEKEGIVRVQPQALTDKQVEYLKRLFEKEIFPILTPISLSGDKTIPALSNLALYNIVALVNPKEPGVCQYAAVEVLKNFPRMITLPSESGHYFILLEDLISFFAKELFTGYEIVDRGIMRLTRGAEMSLDEEKDQDFADVMTEALRLRRQSEIVRLEVFAPTEMVRFLEKKLVILPSQVFWITGWFDLKGISQMAYQPMFENLKRPPWIPRPVIEIQESDNFWDILKEKDLLIHHPYQSFEAVNRFVSAAADDPDVLAIKQTLYRAGSDSRIIAALERAAEKGKRVTVLVELKARFDEERNIEWARRLEIAGANVLYGIAGFKTHAKVCLVVRREAEGIKRYVHLSTGNYNEKTALIYSDLGLFTANEGLAGDVSAFFNMITGFSQPIGIKQIEIAPYGMRKKLIRLILREAMRSTKEKPGRITAKMNSLVDPEIIEALYRASQAGVRIQLNVRGICCLCPGVEGLSENIEVISIVDMFLEHSRIFYFSNGGDSEIYLSSADWMPRNFDRRVEIMFPVESPGLKQELHELLKFYFKDNVKSWRLLPSGTYEKIQGLPDKIFRVQEYLCKKALDLEDAYKKLQSKELKPQKPKHSAEDES